MSVPMVTAELFILGQILKSPHPRRPTIFSLLELSRRIYDQNLITILNLSTEIS
mgnify:CR=1 FL=1